MYACAIRSYCVRTRARTTAAADPYSTALASRVIIITSGRHSRRPPSVDGCETNRLSPAKSRFFFFFFFACTARRGPRTPPVRRVHTVYDVNTNVSDYDKTRLPADDPPNGYATLADPYWSSAYLAAAQQNPSTRRSTCSPYTHAQSR